MTQLLYCPKGVFVSNGEVFIADTDNHRVRKLLRNGQIVTIAGNEKGYYCDGQLATKSKLRTPHLVFVSSSNQVYFSEWLGNCIRKIDQRGMISTIAGTGEKGYNGDGQLAVDAKLNSPYGLFVTEDEEVLFADRGNNRVRKIDRNGIISTLAGNGKGEFNGDGQLATSASLFCPTGVFQYKSEIYLTDTFNHRIRKIDHCGIVSTIAGTGIMGHGGDGKLATDAAIGCPHSVFVHNDHIYLSDSTSSQIREILPNGIITTIAGIGGKSGFNGDDMLATQCQLSTPFGIFVDNDSQVYIADTSNQCIRKIDQNGVMRRVVGTGQAGYSGDVPFDFEKFPHIGPPRKKQFLIKPFPHAYHDLIIIFETMD